MAVVDNTFVMVLRMHSLAVLSWCTNSMLRSRIYSLRRVVPYFLCNEAIFYNLVDVFSLAILSYLLLLEHLQLVGREILHVHLIQVYELSLMACLLF